jgi:uncharacterized protein YndB with AHSA1/START domain
MNDVPEATYDIISTRVFAATREKLFEAFSDPRQLAQWWGPNGFTNTIEEFDFRPGGAWRLTMRAPNGAEYPNESEFVEVVRPERIVFDHLRPVHRFLMTMTYETEGDSTRLTWRMHPESDEGEKMRGFLSAANEENFDRLEAHLASN